MPSEAKHTIHPADGWRDIPDDDALVGYVLRYGGRCRDCADNFGVCPVGLPCDPDESKRAIRHVISAINYGMRHGYLPLPSSTAALSKQPDVAVRAALTAAEARVAALESALRTFDDVCGEMIENIDKPDAADIWAKRRHELAEAFSVLYTPSPAAPALAAPPKLPRLKPLDLSTVIRDAFLAGRGLKDGDKLTDADLQAWNAYDPERVPAFARLSTVFLAALIRQPVAGQPLAAPQGGE